MSRKLKRKSWVFKQGLSCKDADEFDALIDAACDVVNFDNEKFDWDDVRDDYKPVHRALVEALAPFTEEEPEGPFGVCNGCLTHEGDYVRQSNHNGIVAAPDPPQTSDEATQELADALNRLHALVTK